MVNGDEGNPASYMDRSVMEGASHQVLEGLLIGAYPIGQPKPLFILDQTTLLP
ncbi:MAG: hypothetical protein Ct9H300mP23_07130 [Nitrospinota bacterium]|nr:MAG: hypothetical protein Ct9H300mP23_07130 [Nitrospinota bacterium]